MPPFVGEPAATANRSPYIVPLGELIDTFGTTEARRALLRNLLRYRELLAGAGYVSGLQFIDGSFVESVEVTQGRAPNDIDLFSFLNAPASFLDGSSNWSLHGLPFWKDEIINRKKNKERFCLDTYAILLQERDLASLIQDAIYWYSLFSHQRETLAWKGFAAVPLDVDGDQAAKAALGGP